MRAVVAERRVDVGKYVLGGLQRLVAANQHEDVVYRYRPAAMQFALIVFDVVDVGDQLVRPDTDRAVYDQSHCAVRAVAREQNDSAGKIPVHEAATRDEEHPGCRRRSSGKAVGRRSEHG